MASRSALIQAGAGGPARELHKLFRKVSHNLFLMASGLMIDPQGLT